MTLLSWKPVNFDRWLCLAGATSDTAPVQASIAVGKTVAAVTLPASRAIHIFAVAMKP